MQAGTFSTPGWLLWVVAPADDGRAVTFKPRKVAADLHVLADGVVPMYATRADGWVLRHSGVPQMEPMPAWLGAELGGSKLRPA